MMKNKKGFTLVELLAVIIVLIIIMLIAINVITEYTKKSKESAIRADAIAYIKYLTDKAGEELAEESDLDTGIFSIDELREKGIKLNGREPDSGYVFISDYKVMGYCLKYASFKITDINDKGELNKGDCSPDISEFGINAPSIEYPFNGNSNYTFIAPSDGVYLFELWGAQGNDPNKGRSSGGKGGYTSGVISLEKGTKFYIYVGEHRSDRSASFNAGTTGGSSSDTANGGGVCGYGGGGATDVRLTPGSWDNDTSLKSRIMVAGGGGGASDYSYAASGGYGGGLVAGSGINGKSPSAGVPNITPTGGTQVGGGAPSQTPNTGAAGSFGKGGNGQGNWGSAGGGGYYGGGGGGYTDYSVDSGAGGSSYISGYPGCLAIASSATTDLKNGCDSSSNSKECSVHYSGYEFSSATIKSGKEKMPKTDGKGTQTGNSGNGYAKITLLSGEDVFTDEFDLKFPGYKKLEYVQSNGSQYVLTTIIPSNDIGFKIIGSSSDVSNDKVWFGAGNGSGYRSILGNYDGYIYLGYNNSSWDSYRKSGISTNQKYTITVNYYNDRKFSIDGTVINSSLPTLSALSVPYSLFAYHNGSNFSYYSNIKLYGLEITNGGNLVGNYLPCKNESDVAGLCDLVTGSFLLPNTGTLTPGNVIN